MADPAEACTRCVSSISTPVKPAASSPSTNSRRVNAPAMQPVHSAMSRRVASSMPSSAIVEVMRELDIDLTDRRPTGLSPEAAERADVVVTMGCGDECPYILGKRYVD